MKENELKLYTQLMKTRFMEDSGVIFQINGLERAGLLVDLQFEGQIQAFDRQNAVKVLNGGKGLLIGYSTEELPEEKLFKIFQQSSQKLLETAKEDELLWLQNKAIQEAEIIPQNWHLKYYDRDVYHLLTIAIDKSLQGTGAFRELIMPVIQACDNKKLPIVLETFNPENVPLYEHFGFKLMESHSSEVINLTCFCMMRWRQEDNTISD
ncbi:GNAT family N-acetyltransferase [Acetobacterium tundrae]|uniref:GNAT family N-acetyltransferase n=1 Tax=Acetobacterium tundrae TaxID=132932 RepID=A0ABR6WM02_9FIRM|nr:GNAT family N-acetyltransferase [Acetobacterium tundrae]MBC3797514.1 GNAT family N-acetyltransferase [Acetobacterium tundrae]